jgi:multimeric flavodoxin WrbA
LIKILTVSGSPVPDSSTDILLREIENAVAKEIGSGVETESDFVKLNELKITPCQACGEAPTPEYCFYDDDLTAVYEKLAECDCLLMGSPIYFDSVSAQTKLFIDRCNCFRPADFENTDPDHDFIRLLKRKRPGAMVLVGGEQGYFEGARRTIAGFFLWLEVVNKSVLVYKTTDFHRKGTVQHDVETLRQARQLGRKLANMLLKK